MKNQQIEHAWKYHNATRHSPESIRRNVHFLDWENQPLLFKIYKNLETIPLPDETGHTEMPALSAIAIDSFAGGEAIPDLKALTHLLYFSAGITKRRKYPGGEILFRAASCTGALYEVELYVVCGPLPGLDAGVYHFNPGDLSLRRLREGDFRAEAAQASGEDDAMAHAPAIVISTGTYWRNAWKYQARTYRHFGWDNGTLHANLLAAAASLRLPARLIEGFVDSRINGLLALDESREVALSLVALGRAAEPAGQSPEIQPLRLETVPLSKQQRDYPEMREMHTASSLESVDEVMAWRSEAAPLVTGSPPGEFLRLPHLPEEQLPRDTVEEVVLRRGSSRRFGRDPIRLEQLAVILDRSTRGIAADFLGSPAARLNDLYLIVNAVEGIEPGAYFYNGPAGGLELLKHGDFRKQAAFLALEQDLAGDAAVAVFFLADLPRWLTRFGNRGYRAVQMEAGILGGKLYLAAYAQGLGATGLTFFDEETVQFFSPHAEHKNAVFVVALGHPAKK